MTTKEALLNGVILDALIGYRYGQLSLPKAKEQILKEIQEQKHED